MAVATGATAVTARRRPLVIITILCPDTDHTGARAAPTVRDLNENGGWCDPTAPGSP